MIVHFRDFPAQPAAPCGYVFDKSLQGMDYNTTWDLNAPHPVTCPECRLKGPKQRTLRRRAWEGAKAAKPGGKTRF